MREQHIIQKKKKYEIDPVVQVAKEEGFIKEKLMYISGLNLPLLKLFFIIRNPPLSHTHTPTLDLFLFFSWQHSAIFHQ